MSSPILPPATPHYLSFQESLGIRTALSLTIICKCLSVFLDINSFQRHTWLTQMSSHLHVNQPKFTSTVIFIAWVYKTFTTMAFCGPATHTAETHSLAMEFGFELSVSAHQQPPSRKSSLASSYIGQSIPCYFS